MSGVELAAGTACLRRPVEIVARLPELVALFGVGGPGEAGAAMVLDDFLDELRLFGNPSLGAMELEEERRRRGQRQFGIGVDIGDGDLVDEFDTRDRDAILDRGDDGLDRAAHAAEGADRRGDMFRDRMQLHRQLGDDAQRAFRPDEEVGEVVAGGRLSRPRAGADQFAVGRDDLQAHHVFTHRAVTHRRGAAAARGSHAAQRCVGARIDRKHEAGIAQFGVELLARHPRLDDRHRILGTDLDNAVHVARVDGDAAIDRDDMAFHRRTCAERRDGHAMGGADAYDCLDIFLAGRKCHRVRQDGRQPRRVVAVMLAHRIRGDDALSQLLLQLGNRRSDGIRHNACPLPGRLPARGRDISTPPVPCR